MSYLASTDHMNLLSTHKYNFFHWYICKTTKRRLDAVNLRKQVTKVNLPIVNYLCNIESLIP